MMTRTREKSKFMRRFRQGAAKDCGSPDSKSTDAPVGGRMRKSLPARGERMVRTAAAACSNGCGRVPRWKNSILTAVDGIANLRNLRPLSVPSQVTLGELRRGENFCCAYMFTFEQTCTPVAGNKMICITGLTNCDQEVVIRVKRFFGNQCFGLDDRREAMHSIDDQSYSVRLQKGLQVRITRDPPNFFELILRGEELKVPGEPRPKDKVRRIVRRNER